MPKKDYIKKHSTKSGRPSKLTGYRLHDARLSWAKNGTAMRTIKYPLINENTKTVAKNIASDYYYLFGPRSLEDYLKTEQAVSILDLYIMALSLGVVFAPKADALSTSWKRLYPDDPTPADMVFALLAKEWQDVLDVNSWFDFIGSKPRPSGRITYESAKRSVWAMAKDPSKPSSLLDKYANNYAEYILAAKAGMKASFDKLENFGLKKNSLPQSPTYSFVINVRFPLIEITNKTAVATVALDRMHKLASAGAVDVLLGLDSSCSGLNSFLGKFITDSHDGIDVQKIISEMTTITQYSTTEKQIVTERLQTLIDFAKKLPSKPRATKKGWQNYRTFIGGQLKSWASNYVRQKAAIYNQLASLLGQEMPVMGLKKQKVNKNSNPEIISLINEIDEYGVAGDLSHEDLEQIKDTLHLVLKMVEGAYRFGFGADDIFSISSLISSIRPALNEWWQATHILPTTKKQIYINDVYPALFKDFYILPHIMGESGGEKYKKIINFNSIYTNLIGQIDGTLGLLTGLDDVPLSTKELENIRRWAIFSTDEWSSGIVISIFDKLGCKPINEFGQNERFYISPYSKNKKLKIIELQGELEAKALVEYMTKAMVVLNDTDGVASDFTKALAATELCKIIFAILLTHSKDDVFSFEPRTSLQAEFIERANINVDAINKNTFGKIVQALLFAEIRGLLSNASKQLYIERSVISTSDDSDFRLIIDKSKCNDGDPNWPTKARFYITSTSTPCAKPSGKFFVIDKPSGDNPISEKIGAYRPNDIECLLCVGNTTRYQLQFLHWLMKKPKNKHNELSFSGLSLIAEQQKQIVWENSKSVNTKNVGELKLFASIPFTILAPNEKNIISKITDKVLGIDVGEKGLAWVVAERHKVKDKYDINILANGFLRKSEHYLLADKVKDLKKRQAIGTFGSTDTYVARLREALVSNYRSEIDNLAIKYNARIAFEGSISGFETGGNKIGKIYASLKKSEVPAMQEADKAVVAHYWGKQAKSKQSIPGVSILAAGTSQTCSRCGRWNKYYIDTKKEYDVYAHDEHLGEVEISGSSRLMVYSDKKIIPNSISGNDLNMYIYQFMRPPILSAAFRHAIKSSQSSLNIEFNDTWVKENGNSAIFICPFADCLHISDADIQAAQNIAVRGFVKIDLDNSDEVDENDYDKKLEGCYKQIKQKYNLHTIEFDQSLRKYS